MTTRRDVRKRQRHTQLRRRRIGALVGAVVVLILLIWGIGALFGAFSSSSTPTAHAKPTAKPAVVPQLTASNDSWPMFGGTAQNTRANTAIPDNLPLKTLWTTDTGRTVELPPVIGNGQVVAANYGYGVALSLQTGAILWKRPLKAYSAASPALSGLAGTPSSGQPTRAIFATMTGHVLAFDAASGTQEWNVALGSSVETSPLVIGDGIFVGTRSGDVVRISLATGAISWQIQTGGSVKGAIAQSGNNIIFGNYAGKVTAMNPTTGAIVWQVTNPGHQSSPGTFYGAPGVAYGRVYIGNTNGSIVALDAATGKTDWVQTTGAYVYASPAIANGVIFIGSYDHYLYALNALTGGVVWHADLGGPISGSASVIGDKVWIATFGSGAGSGSGTAGEVRALDIHTGKVLATRSPGKYAAPVAVQGTIISTGLSEITALQSS